MRGDRHVDDLSTVVGEDDDDSSRECDRRYDEEVGGHDPARAIGENVTLTTYRW